MATEQLLVRLSMDAKQYNREARSAATSTGTITKEAKTASTSAQTMGKDFVKSGSLIKGSAVAGGFLVLRNAIGTAIGEAERAASAMAVTEQVIKQTGGVANLAADDVADLSARLSSLTGVEDELVQEGANVLLTFRNIRNEIGEGNNVFDRAAELMLDVSTVMNTDAAGAATQLGKALNDPIAGISALSRAGLTFNDQQKDQIRTLVESGQTIEAQKIILKELETQLGGTATAAADASDRLSVAFGNIVESAGTGLLPILEDFADGAAILAGMSPQVIDLADTIKEIGEVNLSDLFAVGQVFGATDFRDTMVEILETANLTDDELRELATGGMQQLRDEFDLSGARAEVLEEILAGMLAEADEAAVKLEGVKAAADADRVLRQYADGIEEIGEELGTAVPDAQDLAAALSAVNSAMLEAANPVFAAQQALARYDEVLKEVKEDGEVTAEEQLAVAEAALEANARLSELGAGNVTAGIQAIADALGISYGEAQGLAEELGILDGTEVNLLFSASMNPADRALLNSVNTATSGGGTSGPKVSVIPGNFRHSGGPGRAGVPYVIRPDEEIFVPSGSGQFLLNDQVMSALRGLGGGGSVQNTYNMPIQSTGDPNADAQLVGAVHSVLRRMESL